jgi:transcriptional regulator with XRE-family HTH domain
MGYYNIHYTKMLAIRDTIMSVFMMTPHEMAKYIAKQAQAKRLGLNFSQQTLSDRSGVSFGVLKKFEQTGKISLDSLLKIALTLGSLEEFKYLFQKSEPEHISSLDDLLKDNKRKRGRK